MKNFSFIKDKLKLNKKRPLLRNLCLLMATVMLFSVAVWAWFVMQQNADAEGIMMNVGTGKNLDMSLDNGKTFHNGIDLLDATQQQYIMESNRIKDKLYMYDITSDGDTFWSPKFMDATDGIRTPDTSKEWTYAATNSAYISENIVFRTTFPAKIYMGKDTTITTSVADDKLVGVNAGNKSEAGDFSRDCIVGALRISAINSNNQLCFVCIPRSDVELYQNGDTYGVRTGNSVTDASKKHTYYPDNYQSAGATVTNNNTLLGFTAVHDGAIPNDSTEIATTTQSSDGYYYGSATVNIWLEGCDAETRRVLSGGKYKINLDFVAYELEVD